MARRLAREVEPEAPRHPPPRGAETPVVMRRRPFARRRAHADEQRLCPQPECGVNNPVCNMDIGTEVDRIRRNSGTRLSHRTRSMLPRARATPRVDRPRRREATCSRQRPGHTQIRAQRPDCRPGPAAGHSRPAPGAAWSTLVRVPVELSSGPAPCREASLTSRRSASAVISRQASMKTK